VAATGYTSNPPSGGGEGGPVAISDVTGLTAALAGKAPTVHTHVAVDVSDSTAVGRSVLTAADAAAARTAIGAGTSSLALGSTGSTAAVGNHGHAIADVTGLQGALEGKSAAGHAHVTADVTGLAESVQDTVGAMVVAGANVTATYDDGAGTLTIAASGGGGGGGGTAPTFARDIVTSGNVAISADASWTPVAGLTLAIPAAIGDNVSLDLACLISHTASSFYELAVLVGGSPVRYASTGTASPAGGAEGDPSMYPLAGGALHPLSTFMDFTVESGDLSGGNVTFALMHLGSGGGQVYASTAFPFRWRARNDHQ
jgi:hypothetical protein